jgi:thymidylate synthase ThyX
MKAELVYDGGPVVSVPEALGTPRVDQMRGSVAEQLIEVAGRTCYDSMGTGRPSGEYHRNLLLEQQHYSVAEHFHVTIETGLNPLPWLGVPDITVRKTQTQWTMPNGTAPGHRVTFNLRHALEWPANVTHNADPYDIDQWKRVLEHVCWWTMPSLFREGKENELRLSAPRSGALWLMRPDPETDTEAHVSVFLEDSLVWALEQNRHRGNISQRSGRFVDQHDRAMCRHPYVTEYLNECGYLTDLEGSQASAKLFTGGNIPDAEVIQRTQLGNVTGSLIAQSRQVYSAWVDRLEPWLVEKKGLDKRTARKQARSAARYYLGNGLSTEGVYTYSIRHWRHIFKMRVSPHADAAINELMSRAWEVVKASRYGHLL